MIQGFEEITADLTEEEIKFFPRFVEVLSKHTKENPITSSKLIQIFRGEFDNWCSGARVRKLVSLIRRHGILPLIATSKGYFVVEWASPEFEAYCIAFGKRIESMQTVKTAMLKKANLYF
ncbi:MAG: hypothetical protein NT007_09845 [Candidatus Kapabacteria bacterium]|nr:hypothetical protein [Candidatus Kapabacteria bacterium]